MFEPGHACSPRAFADHLVEGYRAVYGKRDPDHGSIIRAMAQLAVERISSSDALYHDVHHTDDGDAGRPDHPARPDHGRGDGPEDWLHFTVATLCHDIGYLRGICPGDREGRYVIDGEGNTIEAPRGASDAFLAPYHIERGKIFVRHRCRRSRHLDPERIAQAIELTRFPIPDDDDHADTDTEAGAGPCRRPDRPAGRPGPPAQAQCALLRVRRDRHRAPARLRVAGRSGRAVIRASSGRKVEPYLDTALRHLERTVEGKQWIAQLYAHVFVEEHSRSRPGPARGPDDA